MGLDPVTGIGTGCWPGMKRLADHLFGKFGGWNLGCFNPASRAGGGPSLHAEGRAQDFAFDANDPVAVLAGDALFRWAVEHHEQIGLQEMLWRGAIWYWPRRDSEHGWGDFQIPGVYGPVQQGDHMSHVHMGIDKNAGMNWQRDWLPPDPEPIKEKRKRMDPVLIEYANGIWLWDPNTNTATGFPNPEAFYAWCDVAKINQVSIEVHKGGIFDTILGAAVDLRALAH